MHNEIYKLVDQDQYQFKFLPEWRNDVINDVIVWKSIVDPPITIDMAF